MYSVKNEIVEIGQIMNQTTKCSDFMQNVIKNTLKSSGASPRW